MKRGKKDGQSNWVHRQQMIHSMIQRQAGDGEGQRRGEEEKGRKEGRQKRGREGQKTDTSPLLKKEAFLGQVLWPYMKLGNSKNPQVS